MVNEWNSEGCATWFTLAPALATIGAKGPTERNQIMENRKTKARRYPKKVDLKSGIRRGRRNVDQNSFRSEAQIGKTRGPCNAFDSREEWCSTVCWSHQSFLLEVIASREHQDNIASAGCLSEKLFNMVHAPIDIPKALQIPKAKEAVDKEWAKLDRKSAFDHDSV